MSKCFGNEVQFPETYMAYSGNPLRSIPETTNYSIGEGIVNLGVIYKYEDVTIIIT